MIVLSKEFILKRILPALAGIIFIGIGGLFLLDSVKGEPLEMESVKYELVISAVTLQPKSQKTWQPWNDKSLLAILRIF